MSMFWQHFISNGRGGRDCERLGVHGHEVPLFPTAAGRHGLAQRDGVEVWRVTPGSPAEQAGILDDDILVRLAGQPLGSMEQLGKLARQFRGEVPVEVLRGEVWLERRLRLGCSWPGA